MTRLMAIFAAAGFLAASAMAADTKGTKVDYQVHDGHFESNKSGLTGDASYLAITDKAGFDKLFGSAAVMGKKYNWVPKDAFEKKMVVAVIKRGDAPVGYKVDQVTMADGKLTVQYTAAAIGAAGGSAKFASPLILTVDKGKYSEVVFVENGKQVGTAKIGK